jgi:hypothetical protein
MIIALKAAGIGPAEADEFRQSIAGMSRTKAQTHDPVKALRSATPRKATRSSGFLPTTSRGCLAPIVLRCNDGSILAA